MSISPERTYCPECADCRIWKCMEKDEIPVVLENDVHVKVPVVVPVWHCERCKFTWMDHEASTIRDDAVNAYLFKVGQGRPKEWSPKWNLEK